MITRREDYKYAGGDIDKVIIDGGIMPLRSEENKRVIRGEDVCFAMEFVTTCGNLWTNLVHADKESDNLENKWFVDKFNFTRKLDVSETDEDDWYYVLDLRTFCDVVKSMRRRIFAGRSAVSFGDAIRSIFLSGIPVETDPVDNNDMWPKVFFDYEPVLEYEDMESYAPWMLSGKKKELCLFDVESIYNDIGKARCSSIWICPGTPSKSDFVEVGEIEFPYSMLHESSYMSYSGSEEYPDSKYQGYVLYNMSRPAVIKTTGWFVPFKVMAEIHFDYYYYDGSASVSGAKKWVEDITDITNFSTSGNVVTVNGLTLSKQWILKHPQRCGMPIYTASSQHGCGCRYNVNVEHLFLVSQIDNRIKWW